MLRRSVDYRFSLLNIRLAFTTTNSTAFDWTAIHHDGQGSVRGVTNSAGAKAERTLFRPYGNWADNLTWQFAGAGPVESHGNIGERLDAAAGLLFLNARYMDPQLGMFIQPDWWEVTEVGVGTNRYAYAGGDLVKGRGPGGGSEGGRSVQFIIFGTCGKPFHYMNV